MARNTNKEGRSLIAEKHKMTIIEDDQVHSKASDGNWRPSRVVEEAKQRGLQAIALADHDTTFGVSEAQETGRKIGVNVHSGIEISASYYDRQLSLNSFDVLGLKIDLDLIQPFEKQLANNKYQALSRIVDNFNQYVSSESFAKDNHKKRYPLQDPKVINVDDIIAWKCEWNDYGCEVPYVSDWEVAFYIFNYFAPQTNLEERTLSGNKDAMREIITEYPFLFQRKMERPSWDEAIREIKSANGLAVWNHPGRSIYYKEKGLIREWGLDEEEWFLPEREKSPFGVAKKLMEKGLDGIELYYYRGNDPLHGHMEEQINSYFKIMADRLGLLVTYGSDCHGPRLREPYMGLFGSPKRIL